MLADDQLVDEPETPTAIVTGGASGIGKATCELLARDGYIVGVADRDEVGARAVADACGGFAFAVDITDDASVTAMFERAFDMLGKRLDALVTSAGLIDTTPFMDASRATFNALIDVNVVGTYLCLREAARHMKPGGRICTVAGVAASSAAAVSPAYAASRAAVVSLTHSAATALGALGIAVNGVAPGYVRTSNAEATLDETQRERASVTTIWHRSAEPEEIAEAIVWLLSQRASYVHGEILTIDGGLNLG